ncbi:MAG: ribonuclease P protein component [Anaerolineae bacterium]|nr:ribonuclease P protein component [Thermoflexales bacterium]MDW8054801.1 ribonuclease P protein component [Anaerolineae bacterium]
MLEPLRKREDFERVRREGLRRRGHYCIVQAVPNGDPERTRVGIVAGRSIGRAVKRNRARRLLRESIRLLAGSLASGWDVVLVAQPTIIAERARMQAVKDDLQCVLKQLHLITSP